MVMILLTAFTNLKAQEYKLAVSGEKTLKLHGVGNAEITGYSGNEIIFTTESKDEDESERAEGLHAINSLGLTDNTGIGLSVAENGANIDVNPLSKRSDREYKIQLPQNVKVFYEHSTPYGDELVIKNISSEIEASTVHNDIHLENVTGPMTINTVHGEVDAIFTTVNQSSPISIVSVHGLVDVSLPANTKANLKLTNTWGEIFTDMDIAFDKSSDASNSSTTRISGTINGGGVTIDLSSSHGNIYLRSK